MFPQNISGNATKNGLTVTGTAATLRSMKISNDAVNIELFEGYSNELLTFAWVACIVFIIVGVPGNLLTIVALSRGKQTRNSTAIFIMNLSCSDLLFGCFNLPLAASTFKERAWTHSDLLCRLFPLMRYGLLAVSLFTVSLITINRYIIIAHPRQYLRIYQRRYLVLMVAGTWITVFSIMIPTWRGIWGRFGLDVEIGSCTILHDKNDRSPKEFLFVAAFMVPCICIVICYARIFHLVRKAAIRTREPQKNEQQQQQQQQSPPISPSVRASVLELLDNKSRSKTQSNSNSNSDALLITGQQQQQLKKDISGDEAKEEPLAQECQLQINNISYPFLIDEYIKYIDDNASTDSLPISYSIKQKPQTQPAAMTTPTSTAPQLTTHPIVDSPTATNKTNPFNETNKSNLKTSLRTSFIRFSSRKSHYISIGNTSNASSIYPGRMSSKDRRLLKMILVIFVWFVVCYLPITITKIWKGITEIHVFNISGYLLIYLTTCINPLIYVLMSSEYRRAYWNLLRCRKQSEQQH